MRRKTLVLGENQELYNIINQEYPHLIALHLESPFEAMRLRYDTDIIFIECIEPEQGNLQLMDCLIKEYKKAGAEVYLIGPYEHHLLYREQNISGFFTPEQLLKSMTNNIGIAV